MARTRSPFMVSLWEICVGVQRLLTIFLTVSLTQRCSPTCLTSTPLVTSSSPVLCSRGRAVTQAPSPRPPPPRGADCGEGGGGTRCTFVGPCWERTPPADRLTVSCGQKNKLEQESAAVKLSRAVLGILFFSTKIYTYLYMPKH